MKRPLYTDEFSYNHYGAEIAKDFSKLIKAFIVKHEKRCENMRELELVLTHTVFSEIAMAVLKRKAGIALNVVYKKRKPALTKGNR